MDIFHGRIRVPVSGTFPESDIGKINWLDQTAKRNCMHIHTLDKWRHTHDFVFIDPKGESRTKIVLMMTAITMIAEIAAGLTFGSMALLADGWHMGTHTAAFAITIFAYRYSRKHAENRQFTFGTGKVGVLGGFASAAALAVVALVMALESVERLVEPRTIQFNQAIAVAFLGLAVNVVSAFLLKEHHDSDHEHHTASCELPHDHHHHSHTHDHNLRGAYLHVLADAATSVLAIVALCFGKYFGWDRLDPLTGIAGAILIARWSYGLLKDTSTILLDKSVDPERTRMITEAIEADADNRLADIHVWQVGPRDFAAIISVVTHFPENPEHYRDLLRHFHDLTHITVEVNHCKDEPCFDPVSQTGTKTPEKT